MKKDNLLLEQAYDKVISENLIQDPAISQAMGDIMAMLAIIATAGGKAIITQFREEIKQKAATAQKEKQATAGITNRTISPEEQKAQMDAKAPAFQRQQAPAQ